MAPPAQGIAKLVPCDVLYVHPAKQGVASGPNWRQAANPYLFLPIGVVGLLNLLGSQGISVRGVNVPQELLLDERFHLGHWLSQFAGVRVILIDLHWYEHSYGALEVARLARRCHPDAAIVLGGLTATAFAPEILAFEPVVDYVIRGDAEWPLLDLVEALSTPLPERDKRLASVPNLTFRRGDDIVSNPLTYCAGERELDRLNFADLTWLEHADDYALRQFSGLIPLRGHWLCIGRGCAHACAYCGGGRDAQRALAGRERVIARSVEATLRDIERLVRRGVDQVALNLDLYELGQDYWRALFRGLRERQLRIGIYNEFSGLCSAEFVDELAASTEIHATRLAFSPLSGSEAVRQRNGKAFSNAAFLNLLPHLAEHGLLVIAYFSLNLPGEMEAFEETLALAEQLYRTYPESMLDVINMCHTLDPLSPMSADPQRFGIAATWRHFSDYYDYGRRTRRGGAGARCGAWRGFSCRADDAAALTAMADRWDRAAQGRATWHAVPQTW